jgi:hypothetical protein
VTVEVLAEHPLAKFREDVKLAPTLGLALGWLSWGRWRWGWWPASCSAAWPGWAACWHLADYKQADRELEREEARRGFTIHAIVYAVVMTGLIILNLTVATEFPWAVFPLICWGIGLTLHYLFGVRWVGKVITDRQAKVEQRAAATIRRAA